MRRTRHTPTVLRVPPDVWLLIQIHPRRCPSSKLPPLVAPSYPLTATGSRRTATAQLRENGRVILRGGCRFRASRTARYTTAPLTAANSRYPSAVYSAVSPILLPNIRLNPSTTSPNLSASRRISSAPFLSSSAVLRSLFTSL
jgi:hypothetical protein